MTVSEKLQVVVAGLLGVFGVVMMVGVCIQALEGTSKYSLGHRCDAHCPAWDSANCVWYMAL